MPSLPLSQLATTLPLPMDVTIVPQPDDDDTPVFPVVQDAGNHGDMEATVHEGLKIWKASGSLLAVFLTKRKIH